MPREPRTVRPRKTTGPAAAPASTRRTTTKQPAQRKARQPDAAVQATIEKHAHYCVLGEIASQWLRNRYPGGRWRVIEDMWDEVKAERYRDPVNLSEQPIARDEASWLAYWRKCEILCDERTPKDTREHIKLFLSASTAVSYIVTTEICTKPRWKGYIKERHNRKQNNVKGTSGDILYLVYGSFWLKIKIQLLIEATWIYNATRRWKYNILKAVTPLSQRVANCWVNCVHCYIINESGKKQLKIMSLRPAYDGHLRPKATGAVDLYGLINETIHCTDGSSFLVEDYGTSVSKGDWFTVRDAAGHSKTLQWDEMEALVKLRVPADENP
ncbi:hypothetical protein PLICRDRAFT_680482 [Plicaturopsis crispa FD-325 SS-3]|nr:hypothetical protein PLICRDRAFT_680482 [Plicaturopsis crispa FD-325 SS-3]